MPSGVVFVAILVIWAVILAPRAMKLYERTATQRTTKRFHSAMTVLSGDHAVSRVVIDKARRGSRASVEPRTPGGQAAQPKPDRVLASSPRARPGRAVLRRRRVAALCAGILGLTMVAALGGFVTWIAVPAAGLPLVAYLGACAASAGQRLPSRIAGPAIQASAEVAPNSRPAAALSPVGEEVAPAPTDVVLLSTRRARRSGLRAGSWTHARVLETDLAIAATYSSAEEQLGLDRFVGSPSDVDGEPYLRAANE